MRVRVLRGRPTDAELAALVVALLPRPHSQRARPREPAWSRAARFEQLNAAPAFTASDDRLGERVSNWVSLGRR